MGRFISRLIVADHISAEWWKYGRWRTMEMKCGMKAMGKKQQGTSIHRYVVWKIGYIL